MPHWEAKINIKDLLSVDPSPQAVVDVCDGIQKRMARLQRFPKAEDRFNLMELDDILYEFGYIARTSKNVDELNSQLEELYDWADSNRVWLGL